MKRHRALEPFSRDHYGGLVIARHLMQDRNEASLISLMRLWKEEMEDHFLEEESLLMDLIPQEMANRLAAEHSEIRLRIESAAAGKFGPNDVASLGEKIHNHIRWEERVLFPWLEQSTDMDPIAEATEAMEARRHELPRNALRARQVQRRIAGH